MRTISKKYICRWLLPDLLGPVLCARVSNTHTATIEVGSSPKGTAPQLVLKTIETAQQEIHLMSYSLASPEVAWTLVRAKRRGVGVGAVLDWRANIGRNSNASRAAMNLLVGVNIPVRTINAYKILHDEVAVVDGCDTQAGSFNFSQAAGRSNSKNVLVVWDDPVLTRSYLNHWTSRWA